MPIAKLYDGFPLSYWASSAGVSTECIRRRNLAGLPLDAPKYKTSPGRTKEWGKRTLAKVARENGVDYLRLVYFVKKRKMKEKKAIAFLKKLGAPEARKSLCANCGFVKGSHKPVMGGQLMCPRTGANGPTVFNPEAIK